MRRIGPAHNEARLLRDLQHPNIVSLLAVISEEVTGEEESQWGSVNLLQELVPQNLWQFIEQRGRAELDWTCFHAMATDILSATAFLAQNCIIHHDIKPHNLLVRSVPLPDGKGGSSPLPRPCLVARPLHRCLRTGASSCATLATRAACRVWTRCCATASARARRRTVRPRSLAAPVRRAGHAFGGTRASR